jgi:hypothetical protein
MIEGKGLGGKRVHRFYTSHTNKVGSDLTKLATACRMQPTKMAALLMEKGLYNPQLVNELQKEYCTEAAYRIHLVQKNGEIHFVLRGREDLT